jgi:two-component system sensor kinase FixL
LLVTAAATVGGVVRLSMSDAGAGIPTPLIERLFDPFVTTKAEGLGLGLSIARTIVAAHGGRIWAENNVGRGATIHCELVSVPTNAALTSTTSAFADASIS